MKKEREKKRPSGGRLTSGLSYHSGHRWFRPVVDPLHPSSTPKGVAASPLPTVCTAPTSRSCGQGGAMLASNKQQKCAPRRGPGTGHLTARSASPMTNVNSWRYELVPDELVRARMNLKLAAAIKFVASKKTRKAERRIKPTAKATPPYRRAVQRSGPGVEEGGCGWITRGQPAWPLTVSKIQLTK